MNQWTQPEFVELVDPGGVMVCVSLLWVTDQHGGFKALPTCHCWTLQASLLQGCGIMALRLT